MHTFQTQTCIPDGNNLLKVRVQNRQGDPVLPCLCHWFLLRVQALPVTMNVFKDGVPYRWTLVLDLYSTLGLITRIAQSAKARHTQDPVPKAMLQAGPISSFRLGLGTVPHDSESGTWKLQVSSLERMFITLGH